MNLHALVSPCVSVINPSVVGVWKISIGSTINADGTRTPAFTVVPNITFQAQALSTTDLRHLDALNIQGTMRAVYMNGAPEGVDRPAAKGGDVLQFGGRNWLVTQVLEPWDTDGWAKVAVTLQDN